MAKRSDKGSPLLLVASAALMVVLLAARVKPAVAGEYTTEMEKAVRDVVKSDTGNAPGLVRLLFHDCFVRGCDGSVLLLSTPTNAGNTEQESPRNGGLRGLDMIQKIRDAIFLNTKARINVSCADAIVFAAREATFVLSGANKIAYDIDGPGRKDGVISSAQDPERFLPDTTFTFQKLLDSFKAKGFGVKELVALIGTHGIGVTHKKAFEDRLEPAVSLPPRNEIDGRYQAYIKTEATVKPDGATFTNNLRDMGLAAQISCGYQANGVDAPTGTLDNSIYNLILQNRNRFQSDWVLRTDPDGEAQKLLLKYKTSMEAWKADFSAAMTRLSNELVSEGTKFEVDFRKDCTRTNP